MSADPIMNRLNDRRALLMQHVAMLLEAEARGDGGCTFEQLELLGSELEFYCDLMHTMILIQIKQNLERVAPVGSDG